MEISTGTPAKKRDEIDFSRNLIEGRIAETIFERMMQEEKGYDVIPFGYEHTMPMLAQYRNDVAIDKIIKNIADAPDFALVSQDKKRLYLVEVKYRESIKLNEMKEIAEKLLQRWDWPWMFIATPEGFFCTECSTLLQQGKMFSLSDQWVSFDRQKKYLDLMNEFLGKK